VEQAAKDLAVPDTPDAQESSQGAPVAPNWRRAGVTPNGGIPPRSAICATVSAATYGNGATDASAGIQAAVDACPEGQTVLLGPGLFKAVNAIFVVGNVQGKAGAMHGWTFDAGRLVLQSRNVWQLGYDPTLWGQEAILFA
jgi:hypothetical protein